MRFAADLIWRLHLSRCGARFEGASVVSNYGLGFRGARMLGPGTGKIDDVLCQSSFPFIDCSSAEYGWHA